MITNNVGGNIISFDGNGIRGYAKAEANGYGYHAQGGTANAQTIITNSATIQSQGTGIVGYATARANAALYTDERCPNVGLGGKADATVIITNNVGGNINSLEGGGIFGRALAYADGNAQASDGPGLAVGGTATANVVINNAATINSWNTGIVGLAYAGAPGTFDDPWISKGGTATAFVTISNGGTITSLNGHGIYGGSYAAAGNEFHSNLGYGGTGTAVTIITNTGTIKLGVQS